MDSTTITLFDNILKGVGRHRNQARKRRHESTYSNEVSCRRTDGGAAHIRRKTRSLPAEGGAFAKDSTLAMDRGYVDIAQFQRLTEEGVCYVTKMKKNLKYEELESITYVNPQGLVTHIDKKVLFTKGNSPMRVRRVEIFYETKKPVVLLTNNFEFTFEDISEIYRLRWAIESLYKQLKQNFPLHFFYGDSVNAIQIQTWVVLIANLLITVLSRSIKRHCAFSQVVTMVRLMLMYYVDFIAFMENPRKPGMISLQRRCKSTTRTKSFRLRGLTFEKIKPEVLFYGASRVFKLYYCKKFTLHTMQLLMKLLII